MLYKAQQVWIHKPKKLIRSFTFVFNPLSFSSQSLLKLSFPFYHTNFLNNQLHCIRPSSHFHVKTHNYFCVFQQKFIHCNRPHIPHYPLRYLHSLKFYNFCNFIKHSTKIHKFMYLIFLPSFFYNFFKSNCGLIMYQSFIHSPLSIIQFA